jgi:membrane protein
MDENLSHLCAGVSFYATLSIFPALAAVFTLYALISEPANIAAHAFLLADFFPTEISTVFIDQFTEMANQEEQSLGATAIFGLLLTIWLARRGMHALIHAITIAYNEQETRSFIHISLFTYFLTFCAIIVVVILITGIIGIPLGLQLLKLPLHATSIAVASSWLLFISTSMVSIGVLYRYAPPRTPATWRWLSTGALLGTFTWFTISFGFSLYVSQLGNFQETYGTLSAAAILLIWFYLSTYSIVIGALLNAELEHQTRHDTTIGPEKPMGSRGAHVADTLGKTFNH